MADKFDPAPKDKHAADPKEAQKADKEMHDKLNKGLEGTFPASDPVSTAKSKRDAKANSLRLHTQREPHCKVADGYDHEGQADRDGGVSSNPSPVHSFVSDAL